MYLKIWAGLMLNSWPHFKQISLQSVSTQKMVCIRFYHTISKVD